MPWFEDASDDGPNTAFVELVHGEGEGHETCAKRFDEEYRDPDAEENEDETATVSQYDIRRGEYRHTYILVEEVSTGRRTLKSAATGAQPDADPCMYGVSPTHAISDMTATHKDDPAK